MQVLLSNLNVSTKWQALLIVKEFYYAVTILVKVTSLCQQISVLLSECETVVAQRNSLLAEPMKDPGNF